MALTAGLPIVTSAPLHRLLRHQLLRRRASRRAVRFLSGATRWQLKRGPGPPPGSSFAICSARPSSLVALIWRGGRSLSRVGFGAGVVVRLVLPGVQSPLTWSASVSIASPPHTLQPSATKELGASAAGPLPWPSVEACPCLAARSCSPGAGCRYPPATVFSACGAAGRAAALHQPRRVSVWQHISPITVPADATLPQRSPPAGAACGMAAAVQHGSSAVVTHGSGDGSGSRAGRRRRRRRRPHFRQRAIQEQSGSPPEALPEVSSEAVSANPPALEQPLPWTDHISRAEAYLAHAVIVTVIGDEPLAEARLVAAGIAARMDVEANSVVLRRASVSSYLLGC